MGQVRGLIRDVLFYGILLVAVILGVPFCIGVWVGKVSARRGMKSPAV